MHIQACTLLLILSLGLFICFCCCVVVWLQVEEGGGPPPKHKYAVRPPRDLASKFEVRMEEKERGKIEEIKKLQREEEQAAQAVSA